MRLIVIGALGVVALAIALLFEVTSHSSPASSPLAPAAHATTTAPPASIVTAPPPVTAPALATHARAMPAARTAPSLAPVLPAPSTDPAKPKHVDTPTDILRWSLMRAIRTTEPAVIDCLDKAKAAGTIVDGTAMFAFYVTTVNAKPVIDRASVDASPFPDAVNTCIQATLATGELDQQLPEGRNEFRVLRKLVVDKGVITQYKLQSFLAP